MIKRRTTRLVQCFDVEEIMSFFTTCFDVSVFRPGRFESYPFWAFIYTKKGTLTFRIGERDYEVKEGDLLFYPPDVPHTITAFKEKRWEVCFATFTCNSEKMGAMEGKTFKVTQEIAERIASLFSFGSGFFQNPLPDESVKGMYCSADESELYKLKSDFESILTDICYSVEKKDVYRQDNVFSAAVRYMSNHIGSMITLSDIAASVGVSVSTLKKAFARESGGGVNEYFIRMKLKRGEYFLCNTDMSVGEIAEMLGYSSQFYFSELFKSRYGVSPHAYRKQQEKLRLEMV